MTRLDKLMEHKDEYIIEQIVKHRGLIRSVLDYLNEEEENGDSGNTL